MNKKEGTDKSAGVTDKSNSKSIAQNDQASIVSKVLKNKNRFRAGLGFKESKNNQEDKFRIAQNVSKKKIVKGTRAEKVDNIAGSDDDEEGREVVQAIDYSTFETGSKNTILRDGTDENELVSVAASKKKSTYYDPRQAFLDQIKANEKKTSENAT